MQTLLILISVIDDVKLASMASEAVSSNVPTSVQRNDLITESFNKGYLLALLNSKQVFS